MKYNPYSYEALEAYLNFSQGDILYINAEVYSIEIERTYWETAVRGHYNYEIRMTYIDSFGKPQTAIQSTESRSEMIKIVAKAANEKPKGHLVALAE